MSATPDSTLANPEQRIADLERQLAEREAELAEARDQQTATTEVLQVINSSPGDLAPVFDAMLEKAMRLCEAPFGALLRFNSKVFRTIAARDTSGAAAVLGDPVEPDPGSALERLVLGDEVVHIPDVVDTEAYRSGVASRLKLVEMIGARTALWVALRNNDVLLGGFALYRKEVRPFTDKQIALLQNFAAQAVIAMENARLITETREALEQQTATTEVLQVINSSPGDLAPVFDAMLEKATGLCGAAFGLLFTWDGDCFHPVAWRGISRELLAVLREPSRPQPGTLTWRIARGENIVSSADLLEAVSTADLLEAEAYRNGIARVRALVDFGGARSHIGIALRKDGAVLGHLSIYRQEVRPFTDKEIALLPRSFSFCHLKKGQGDEFDRLCAGRFARFRTHRLTRFRAVRAQIRGLERPDFTGFLLAGTAQNSEKRGRGRRGCGEFEPAETERSHTIKHRHLGAVARGHLGRVGLDLVPAIFAPHDQPPMRRRGIAERH
jgi:GAF domain-containing protein